MSEQQSLLQTIIETFQAEHHPMHLIVLTEKIKKRNLFSITDLEAEVRIILQENTSNQFEVVAPNTFKLSGYDWFTYPERWNYSSENSSNFRLRSLGILNFRKFEDIYFELSSQFTVFAGSNGSGKTALLDAIALGLTVFFIDLNNIGLGVRKIDRDDNRKINTLQGNTYIIEDALPLTISCRGKIGEEDVFWTRGRTQRGGIKFQLGVSGAVKNFKAIVDAAQKGKNEILPIIAYFGTGRLWSTTLRAKDLDVQVPQSRLAGYEDWYKPFSNERKLIEWFKTRTLAVLQESKPDLELQGVQQAIKNCLPFLENENWEGIEYNVRQGELVAFRKNRTIYLPFRLLSDGYRNWIAMVADIARRTVMLNPHLGEHAISKTPGVVLIDEIDLHLHPKWQRREVDDLKRTFPQIQFIATTHSPFIIQSLQEGELIRLDSDDPVDYVDKSIEDIAEDVMGVENPQRSQRYQDKVEAAKEYLARLETTHSSETNGNKATKEELDALIAPFSDDPAYLALLEMERLVSESKKQDR